MNEAPIRKKIISRAIKGYDSSIADYTVFDQVTINNNGTVSTWIATVNQGEYVPAGELPNDNSIYWHCVARGNKGDKGEPGTIIVHNDPENYVIGVGVQNLEKHSINTAASLLTGKGTIAVGDQSLKASTNNTYSNFLGYAAGLNANNLYCVNGVGIRTLKDLTDGQYIDAIGTDAGFSVTYARNSLLIGAKSALHKTKIQASTVLGVGAAYGAGEVDSSLVIGSDAMDGGLDSNPVNINNMLAIGNYAARNWRGGYNTVIGHNAGSLVPSTAAYITAIGRSAASSVGSGSTSVFVGDSAGNGTTVANAQVCIGYNAKTANANQAIAIGYNASAQYTDSLALGTGATAQAAQQFRLGGAATTISIENQIVVTSDKRHKIHVSELASEKAAAIVLGANIVEYRKNSLEQYKYPEYLPPTSDLFESNAEYEAAKKQYDTDYSNRCKQLDDLKKNNELAGKRIHAGLYAQDEYSRLEKAGIDCPAIQNFSYNDNGEDKWAISYDAYIPYLIKVIQDLNRKIEKLES